MHRRRAREAASQPQRSANRRHRHWSAGGIVRRSPVHALQGRDGGKTGRTRDARSIRFPPSPCSGSSQRITTGTKSRRASCSMASLRRRAITLPPPPGAGHTPIGLLTPGDPINAATRSARGDASFHRVQRDRSSNDLRDAYRPTSAWPTRSRAGWSGCSAISASSSSIARIVRRSRW